LLFYCKEIENYLEIGCNKPQNSLLLQEISIVVAVTTLLLTLALVALAVMLLGVRIFFVRGGKFPNTHIHGNVHMKKRGITCAHDPEFYK